MGYPACASTTSKVEDQRADRGVLLIGLPVHGGRVASVCRPARGVLEWHRLDDPAHAYPRDGLEATFAGVSCSSASACTAVGQYLASGGATGSLVERWNGTEWSIQPNPTSGATTDDPSLGSVSCPSATSCTAVGSSLTGPLAEKWNGSTWSILPTPTTPPGAASAAVNAVSCSSANLCTATGNYQVSIPVELALAERWNGTQWTIQPTPNPAGATDTILQSVSCATATACTATGIADVSAVAEKWNGGTWTIEPTPSPANAQEDGLNGVSCTAPGTCTAVGFWNYDHAGPTGKTLAEHKQASS